MPRVCLKSAAIDCNRSYSCASQYHYTFSFTTCSFSIILIEWTLNSVWIILIVSWLVKIEPSILLITFIRPCDVIINSVEFISFFSFFLFLVFITDKRASSLHISSHKSVKEAPTSHIWSESESISVSYISTTVDKLASVWHCYNYRRAFIKYAWPSSVLCWWSCLKAF